MRIRPVTPADEAAWLALRRSLWPGDPEAGHRAEIARYLAGDSAEPQLVLLALEPSGRAIGLAELSIRPFAEGCRSTRVAYLEGWYVEPRARGRGVGRALVEAAMDWGRAQGCSELASDSLPDDEASRRAHGAVGFEDVGLVRCYRMVL